MDHLFDAQARVERILTSEVFNLVQRGPVWIKSAIMPRINCLEAAAPARRFDNAPGTCAMAMFPANPRNRTAHSKRPNFSVAPGGYSECVG